MAKLQNEKIYTMKTILFVLIIVLHSNKKCHVYSFTIPSARTNGLQTRKYYPIIRSKMYSSNNPNKNGDNNDQSMEGEGLQEKQFNDQESTTRNNKNNDSSLNHNSVDGCRDKQGKKIRNKTELEWNTSIFPTKVTMKSPVEQNQFLPQLYIQSIAGLIGILTGVSVSMFKLSIDSIRQFFYDGDLVSSGLFPMFLVPVIGGVAVSIIGLTGDFNPGLRGVVKEVDEESLSAQFQNAFDDDPDDESNSINDDLGQLAYAGKSLRKSLAAIMTLGTGNSLGPEGPGVEIGTAISRLGMLLWPMKYNDCYNGRVSRNRLLLACGAAAGVSSGFNAPLSGVFFALEVVQASLKPVDVPASLPADDDTRGISSASTVSNIQLQQQSLSSAQGSITAILISSVVAALVAQVLLGKELALELVAYEIKTPLVELPLYILLGMSCGLVSVMFSQSAKFFKDLFSGNIGPESVRDVFSTVPTPTLPIVGGLTCGVVGHFYPQVLFFGYETLNRLLEDNSIPIELLLTLLAAKMFTTAISAGSGLVGGE